MHHSLIIRVLTYVNAHNNVNFVVIRYVHVLLYLLLIYLHAFLLVYVFCVILRGLLLYFQNRLGHLKCLAFINHRVLNTKGNECLETLCLQKYVLISPMQFRSFVIPNSHWICRDTVCKVIDDLYPSFKTFFTVQQIANHWDFLFYTEKFDTSVCFICRVITVKVEAIKQSFGFDTFFVVVGCSSIVCFVIVQQFFSSRTMT